MIERGNVHPVYIVISQHQYSSQFAGMNRYGLPHTILGVWRCDVTEIEDVWKGPAGIMAQLPGAQSIIYSVPSTDIFKDIPTPEKPAGWLPGDDEQQREASGDA